MEQPSGSGLSFACCSKSDEECEEFIAWHSYSLSFQTEDFLLLGFLGVKFHMFMGPVSFHYNWSRIVDTVSLVIRHHLPQPIWQSHLREHCLVDEIDDAARAPDFRLPSPRLF